MNKRQQREAIDRMYVRLAAIIGAEELWGSLWPRLWIESSGSEKKYRRLIGPTGRPGLTVKQATKLRICRNILDQLVESWEPLDWYHVASLEREAVTAFALAETYRSKLLAEIGTEEAKNWLEAVDYAQLMG